MDTKLGLDKLQFFLPTDEIKFSPDFQPRVHRIENGGTGASLSKRTLYVADGRTVVGSSAIFQTDDFSMKISPAREGGASLCSVQFSAGAFASSNLDPLDLEAAHANAKGVEAVLLENGVELDLSRALLTRLDMVRNVPLSQPVACYAPALAAIGARKRANKADYGGTGFLLGNKSWQACFYDKGAEMLAKDYPPEECPKNTLRPEVRLMNSKIIKHRLGCSSLSELKIGFKNLRSQYRETCEKEIFRPKIEANTEASIDFSRLARFVCDGDSKRKYQAFSREGMPLFLVHGMGLERAKVFVGEAFDIDGTTEAGRRQLSRIYSQLEKANHTLKMEATTKQGQEVKALYREVRRAVLNV